jgi:peroxiredoxin
MVSLYNSYKDKGVSFVGINSNKEESEAVIKTHAKDNGLSFTILKDKGNVVADQLGASATPEVFVLSPEFKLLYHGRIDDKRRETEVTSSDLKKALDEILSSKSVSVNSTKAFGCSIKRAK